MHVFKCYFVRLNETNSDLVYLALSLTAETERKGTDHLDLAGVPPQKPCDAAPLPSSPETKKKSSGFRKFFGR